MTLNILLATESSLYLASDFRLVAVTSGAVLSDHSPKLVVTNEEGWSAAITYCGIGSWQKETYMWLKDWLKHEPTETREFNEMAYGIASQAERWMLDIQRSSGLAIMPHSFLMAAFVDKIPKIALVSNFDSLSGPKRKLVSDKFTVEIRNIRSSYIVVTGQSDAVSRADRRSLLAVVAGAADADAVSRSIARVVARASTSANAHGTVSNSCYTYSLLHDGRSDGRLHGKVSGRFVPVMLERGIDFLDLIQVQPAPGRQIQVSGMTRMVFPTAGSEQEECRPEIVLPGADNPGENVSLTELQSLGGPTSRANALNRSGQVVGESWLKYGGPPHACLWSEEHCPRDLGTLGGPSSIAKDVNDRGEVVGSSINASNENHAFLWTFDEGMRDLGTLGGLASHASAINNSGSIVGASWTIPGRSPGDKRGRGFLWTRSEGMRELGELSAAHDINDLDQIVGTSSIDGFSRAFMWTPTGGLTDWRPVCTCFCHQQPWAGNRNE